MYLLWMGLCLISTVLVYFYIPETKRLPVEEIGALFGDDVIIHLTADGHGIVEAEKELNIIGNLELTKVMPNEQGISTSHYEEANI